MRPIDEHVEHDADDDLVDEVLDRERREHERDEHAGDHRARPGRANGLPVRLDDDRRAERAGQQLALDRDVDDAGALADHTAERTEDERDRQAPRRRRAGPATGIVAPAAAQVRNPTTR